MPSITFQPSNFPKDPQLEIRRGKRGGFVAGNQQGHADGMGTSFQGIWGAPGGAESFRDPERPAS